MHNITFTILNVGKNNSVALNTFTVLCTHHHSVYPKPFHHPRHKPIKQNSFFSALSAPSGIVPVLDNSYQWNLIQHPVCLAYFTKRDVFKDGSCCSYVEFHSFLWLNSPVKLVLSTCVGIGVLWFLPGTKGAHYIGQSHTAEELSVPAPQAESSAAGREPLIL